MSAIHERNLPWTAPYFRAEILDHPSLISFFAKWIRPEVYVEYGVASGDSIKEIQQYCKKTIGVDIELRDEVKNLPGIEFYEMSTREFGKILKEKDIKIDMIFIDACHDSHVAFEDFEDVFPFVNDNGFIFIHDTYPPLEILTQPKFCNDSWKVPHVISNFYGGRCEVLTIPVCPGLTVIKKTNHNLIPWASPNTIDMSSYVKN